jgi:segregation and condensation protein B
MNEKPEDLMQSYASMMETPWEPEAPPPPIPEGDETAALSPVRIVEALLFVGGTPLTTQRAGEIIRGLLPEHFVEIIRELNQTYRAQQRPYAVLPQGQGYVLTLRPKYQWVMDKLYGGQREARLSTSAIDALALVAYRQPATKAEIDSVRGGDSGGLLRQLVRRGLVQVLQRADAAQREVSYGTTQRFLDLFGLQSLDDLPRTQDLQML